MSEIFSVIADKDVVSMSLVQRKITLTNEIMTTILMAVTNSLLMNEGVALYDMQIICRVHGHFTGRSAATHHRHLRLRRRRRRVRLYSTIRTICAMVSWDTCRATSTAQQRCLRRCR